ncbi:MAG: hypothetical protein U0703_03665 [Anaerolineae bacterium]
MNTAAAALIHEGDTVALDASSTVFALVPHLRNFRRLTVITNSLITAQSLLDSPQINVLLPGGRLRRDRSRLSDAPEELPDVNLNIGFGARGRSPAAGSDIDADEVVIKQEMTQRCARAVLLVDASKWGQVAPYTFIRAENIRHIITAKARQLTWFRCFVTGARAWILCLRQALTYFDADFLAR